jgi:hypothetical protein
MRIVVEGRASKKGVSVRADPQTPRLRTGSRDCDATAGPSAFRSWNASERGNAPERGGIHNP